MTVCAVVIEVVYDVIRVNSQSETGAVTVETLERCAGIARTMTRNTGQGLVCTGESKLSLIVVKRSRRPCCVGMARQAIMIKITRLVVGIGGLRKVTGMTGNAKRRDISISGRVT